MPGAAFPAGGRSPRPPAAYPAPGTPLSRRHDDNAKRPGSRAFRPAFLSPGSQPELILLRELAVTHKVRMFPENKCIMKWTGGSQES
jgi:hypothetical protein